MSSFAFSLPPIPTSKRSACDRCRSQKLRCPPREHGTDTCMRCTRVGAKCMTSYPTPAGRAPKAIQVASQLLSNPQSEIKRTRRGSASGSSSMTTFASTQSPPSATTLETSPISQSARPLAIQDPFPFSIPGDNLDIFTSRPMEPTVPDASIFFDRIHHDDTGGQLYDDLDDFSIFHPLPAPTGTSSTDSTDATKEERQQNGGSIHDHVLGCDHRLSSLNLDLARQLQQCLAISRSQESPVLDINSDSPPATDSGKIGEEGKLLSDALNDTSDFLAIIQSYGPERRGSSSGTIDSTSPRLGIIVTLNLLSVYLQLVVIYDKLFQCLSNQLFDASVGSGAGLQTLPELKLAGFSVQRGNLQSKILIHAILHQFEMIESILGLPTEFRVTEKQDNYSGLFEDGRARSLLEAMSNGKWCHAAIDDHCGLKALSSLREMLKRVQTSLNM